MKKMIIIAGGAVLLIGITAGAMFFLFGDDSEASIDTDGVSIEAGEESESTEEENVKKEPPIYFGLNPNFVVAFKNPKDVRFIKASIEILTRDSDVVDGMELHMPAIRDAILLLFNDKESSDLSTRDGVEQFRGEILSVIINILEENGENAAVEAVYFTAFVMQ